ncbi:MAG TPA: hypothetical protein VGF28_12095 [Thermoanaerobaculia bacterium]|jgi:hypothetical protein
MHAAIVVLALLDLNGSVALRGVNATGPASWLEGGWGRLEAGGDEGELLADAHLGVDWTSRHFGARVSGTGGRDAGGGYGGLVEAYVEGRVELGLDELQLRAGQFFLPTSRENKDDLWRSPYTMSFSALNSWIGEEVRPIGADLQYRHVTARGHAVTGGATAFRGNDTMGTLLAWRGWSSGSRLAAFGEVLPLPPLPSLPRYFPLQREDGTQPFGRDLDGRTGYSARVRYSVPERANVQYTFIDNRGDRLLHRGEYAWATHFHLVGAEAGDPDRLTVAAEYMTGSTGMGGGAAFVDADFYATYVLVSQKAGRSRFTARYERFHTEERDFSAAESNAEQGRAWTVAWLYDLRANVRVGAELTRFTGARPGTPDPDARNVRLEARYRF